MNENFILSLFNVFNSFKKGEFMKENLGSRGVVILVASSIILKLLSSLYIPILSQILTDDGLAIYTVGYDVFIFLFALTSLGFQPVITKLIAEQRAKGSNDNALSILKVSKKVLFIYGGIVSFLFAILSKPLSILFNSEQSKMVFIFLSPTILLASMLSVYRGFFQGYNDIIELSISNIIEQILNVIFSLLFAFQLMKLSIVWGSVGGTIGTTIGALGAIIYIKYLFNKKYINRNEFKNTLGDSKTKKLNNKDILTNLFISVIPFIFIASINNSTGIIDTFTIRAFSKIDIDINTSTLKYFTTIINVPLVIITSLGIGIFPKIIKGYVERNKEELIIQTTYCYKLTYIITIPSICGLIILSKDIFKLVFNRNFGYEILIVGAISLIFMALSTIQNIVLQGINKFNFIIKLGLIALIIKIFINVIFINIDSINVIGAVIGTMLSLGIVTLFNHINLQRYFGIKIPIIKQSKAPLIASIVMSSILFLLRYKLLNKYIVESYSRINIGIITIILITVSCIVYFLTLLFQGGISKYELDTVSPKIYKALPSKIKVYLQNML